MSILAQKMLVDVGSESECATPSECGTDGNAFADSEPLIEILHVASVPSVIDDQDVYFNINDSEIILEDEEPGTLQDDFIQIFRLRLIHRISVLQLCVVASMSVDILTGFDVLLAEKRQEVMAHLRARQPRSAMLSPPRTMFSQLMNTNWARMDPAVVKRRWQRGHGVAEICCGCGLLIMGTGGYFVLEHPTGASSWRLPDVQALIVCAECI